MSSSPAHWSKDFVEHLRTVHFTLISVSTGLILIALSTKPYNPVVAFRQIHQILELKKLWKPEWVADRGIYKVIKTNKGIAKMPIQKSDLSTPGMSLYGLMGPKAGPSEVSRVLSDLGADPISPWEVSLPVGGKNVVLYGVHGKSVVEFSIDRNWLQQDTAPNWSPDTFPNTLVEFRWWWNVLEKEHYKAVFPLVVEQTDILGNPKVPKSIALLLSEEQEKQPTQRSHLSLTVGKDSMYYGGMSSWGPVRLNVKRFMYTEISHEGLALYFQNWRVFGYRDPKGDSFDSYFLDLARAAHELESLELEDIDKIISEEASKGSEVFEAFGMKFPAAQITIWGIVALLGVQVYFLLYLKQLDGKLRPSEAGWDVPWLGMNTFWLARGMFFFSVVVLPLFALGALFWHVMSQVASPVYLNLRFSGKLWLPAVAFLVTATLGVSCWHYRPRLQGAAATKPSPTTEDVSPSDESSA